jgi:UDP-N-acetylglucosamine 2-epimerase
VSVTKLKVMTIIGTRPEIIRLSECIKACDRYFNHRLVHTGQNWDYTLNAVFFQELGLREPDYYLNVAGANLGATMGNIIAKAYEVLAQEMPDALLILGDTNSALSAIAAKRLKIPIFHMEAGNRCFDQNVPEEINRKIVDHISDVNLPYTEHARRYLLAEGICKERIFVTGSPLREVLFNHAAAIDASMVLEDLGLEKGQYLLVSAHREENIDQEHHFTVLMTALNDIASHYQIPVIYSTHPRSFKTLEQRRFQFHPLVRNHRPFGFFDYIKLQRNSFCVLSDSGTLSEESAILNFPAVLLRTSTEHPEVLDQGTVVIGGINAVQLKQAIELTQAMQMRQEKAGLPSDYEDTNVAAKVVKLIQSYTQIINIFVWRK